MKKKKNMWPKAINTIDDWKQNLLKNIEVSAKNPFVVYRETHEKKQVNKRDN